MCSRIALIAWGLPESALLERPSSLHRPSTRLCNLKSPRGIQPTSSWCRKLEGHWSSAKFNLYLIVRNHGYFKGVFNACFCYSLSIEFSSADFVVLQIFRWVFSKIQRLSKTLNIEKSVWWLSYLFCEKFNCGFFGAVSAFSCLLGLFYDLCGGSPGWCWFDSAASRLA